MTGPAPTSIARRLLWRLLAAGALVSVALSAGVAALVARQTGELLDYQLEQVARVLISHDFGGPGLPRVDDPAMHLDFQVWDAGGQRLYRSADTVDLPLDTPLGFSRQVSRIEDRGDGVADEVALRVLTLRSAERTVQVLQPLPLREELARDAGLEMLLATLAALAALSLLTILTVRRTLQPLRRLNDELGRRGATLLDPIALPDAPTELQRPLATLNALLARLDTAFAAHRHFIADAAHQLRTPLAAVRLQVDNAAHAADEATRQAAMAALTQGVDRLQRLVEQLLALARLESPERGMRARTRVDLHEIAAQCLVDLAPAASQRRVELALAGTGRAVVDGDAQALRMMLDNLVDNAIKYAPPDTVVELGVRAGDAGVEVRVQDHGPGIPEHARERVLERFYRHAEGMQPGSGLGLAIVSEVARTHGAALDLSGTKGGAGLCVRVRLPAAAG